MSQGKSLSWIVIFITTVITMAIAVLLAGCSDDTAGLADPPTIDKRAIYSHEFLNNRFFRLDLPADAGLPVRDEPGRVAQLTRIDPASIMVFRRLEDGPLELQDVAHVAAYLDSTGTFWQGAGSPAQDFRFPGLTGARWGEVGDFRIMMDPTSGQVSAIDLGTEEPGDAVLAVVYDVVDAQGQFVYRVGDRPAQDADNRVLVDGQPELHFRMKLLKGRAQDDEPHLVYLCKRNIYDLGRRNIDLENTFLVLQRADGTLPAHVDAHEVPYLQLFGLDLAQADGQAGPDGWFDIHDPLLLDPVEGLLTFPMEMPFAAGREVYAANVAAAGNQDFQWEGTFLAEHQVPQYYASNLSRIELEQFPYFVIGVSFHVH